MEPNDLWIRAVDDLTDAQIRHALELLVKQGGDHPPTLPKFVELARRPEGGVRNTYEPVPHLNAWQKAANVVFHRRLKASLQGGKPMVPVERSVEMVEALRAIKTRYARDFGNDPKSLQPQIIEAFCAEVDAMFDGLSADA